MFYSDNSNKTLNKFENRYDLLELIYMKFVSKNSDVDLNGAFFIKFYDAYPPILQSYLNHIIKDNIFNDTKLCQFWNTKNYFKIITETVQFIIDNESSKFKISGHLEKLFLCPRNKSKKDIILIQDDWITRYVDGNCNDKQKMYYLFQLISSFEYERRRKFILHFLEVNQSYDFFEILPLVKLDYGGFGSMVPYIEAKVDFLRSLLPYLHGSQFLKHKCKVQSDIETWERQIRNEKVEDKLANRSF
ncbi:hypothetical protein MsAg5_02970 [Methanosarcinaceae archaeon Ag5]|uniref:Uncharacterized protein n=1 Tax=Methanolapillus africanus TaxID=3028297 RepID=A0AAE4MIY8_9EURY|nr:hypothetical protein [Methanosarcinaceae archaeon Ag5]